MMLCPTYPKTAGSQFRATWTGVTRRYVAIGITMCLTASQVRNILSGAVKDDQIKLTLGAVIQGCPAKLVFMRGAVFEGRFTHAHTIEGEWTTEFDAPALNPLLPGTYIYTERIVYSSLTHDAQAQCASTLQLCRHSPQWCPVPRVSRL
jgi:hypothetical protein